MPSRHVIRVTHDCDSVSATTLRSHIAAISTELELPGEFPPEVLAEAAEVVARVEAAGIQNPESALPFVTMDPASSMDLDQAFYLERTSVGYVVHYAIADVHAFVTPDGEIDIESRKRGETIYGADTKISLHPPTLSEGAASLLPDQVRPALLWRTELDERGEIVAGTVSRTTVKSIAKLSYSGVQAMFDADDFPSVPAAAVDSVKLLREIGELRIAREAARGGIDLPLPSQEIDVQGERWRLERRAMFAVEDWNAQLSLLTGFSAASIMLAGRVGLLRTLPPADPRDVSALRRTARSLGFVWAKDVTPADFIRTLDPNKSADAAMVVASTSLLRGSGYVAFDGEVPEQTEQAALASAYAHVTAPLRRLIDRYAGEICVALCAEEPVPAWVLDRLEELPALMQGSGRRAGGYERALLDLIEAGILETRVGEVFTGTVTDLNEKRPTRGTISIADPAIQAQVSGISQALLGESVQVRLTQADLATRKVAFELVDEA